ncbi:hypothetical protein F4802DRAFT_572764 [Xylaria palmicola]|nr:hypothetical protein F4802DRAFT_572764 [Xylaria palmicola]
MTLDGDHSVKILRQATTLSKSFILHEQSCYTSRLDSGKTAAAFGPTAKFILSGACVYGEEAYGRIEWRMSDEFQDTSGYFPTPWSLTISPPISPGYAEYLGRKLADLVLSPYVNPYPELESVEDHVFLLGEEVQSRSRVLLLDAPYARDELQGAKTASQYFPHVTIPGRAFWAG